MKVLLVVVSCLTIALVIYFFKPSNGFSDLDEPLIATETEVSNVVAAGTEIEIPQMVNEDAEQQEADLEYEIKLQRFKELEKSRRNLDRSLSRLKAFSWKVKLPKEEAEVINKELISAYSLLKNKKLMGAFRSLDEMEDELKKVNYSHNKAKEIIERMKGLPKRK